MAMPHDKEKVDFLVPTLRVGTHVWPLSGPNNQGSVRYHSDPVPRSGEGRAFPRGAWEREMRESRKTLPLLWPGVNLRPRQLPLLR